MKITNQDIYDLQEYLKDKAKFLNSYPAEERLVQILLIIVMSLREGDVL